MMKIANGFLTLFLLIASNVVFAFDATPSPGEITSGRGRALIGVAFGLVSLVVGGFVLLRSSVGRIGAVLAVVLGLIGGILSVIHLGGSPGGFGTGGGRLGAIVALVLSLIGIALGGVGFVRSRQTSSERS